MSGNCSGLHCPGCGHSGGWAWIAIVLGAGAALAAGAAGVLTSVLWALAAIVGTVAAGGAAAAVAVIVHYRRPAPATVLHRPQAVYRIDPAALPPRAARALPAALDRHPHLAAGTARAITERRR